MKVGYRRRFLCITQDHRCRYFTPNGQRDGGNWYAASKWISAFNKSNIPDIDGALQLSAVIHPFEEPILLEVNLNDGDETRYRESGYVSITYATLNPDTGATSNRHVVFEARESTIRNLAYFVLGETDVFPEMPVWPQEIAKLDCAVNIHTRHSEVFNKEYGDLI